MSRSKEALYLQTTEVPALKSIGEITTELVKRGSRSIQTLYENGNPTGLEWSMLLYDHPVFFRLPVKVEPVYKTLRSRASGYIGADRQVKLQAQAERIAWRQMLVWIRLQMALIELGMVEYAQVFLPYVTGDNGRTMWEIASETHFKRLEAPKQ